MKKRVLTYLERVEHILEEDASDTDWSNLLSEHLIQIQFFQHERMIHLIVTVTVILSTIISIGFLYEGLSFFLLGLLLLEFVLLVPYILHYYLLENSVQKMYEQYDKILKRVK